MHEKWERANTIMVGAKPVMNYVLACLTLFQTGAESITVKARGRAISKAVDVAQITTKRFRPDITVKKVSIDTEEIRSADSGRINHVSSIEIRLSK
jgi:DNA-binding protein